MYGHHADKRPLGEVIAASNRALGGSDHIDWTRTLAVAVIGDALHDLTGKSRSNNQGHKITPKTASERIRGGLEFFASPSLDAWAQCTSLSAEQWRDIARRIAG